MPLVPGRVPAHEHVRQQVHLERVGRGRDRCTRGRGRCRRIRREPRGHVPDRPRRGRVDGSDLARGDLAGPLLGRQDPRRPRRRRGRRRARPDEAGDREDPARRRRHELTTGATEAIRRIASLARQPGRLLVVADFDGTLAEGSRDPGAAVIVPLARRSLRRLARVAAARPARVVVAILTGRTAADVAARVSVGGLTYLGDHGLQHGSYPRGGRPSRIVTTFRAGHEASFEPAERLAARVPAVLGHPAWLFVERKGPSVAFHVRQADDRAAARAAVVAAIAEVDGELPPHDLTHYRGRLVVDLRPRTAGGKAEAFTELLADVQPATVVAFGDDVSDADGFAVLRAARDEGRCGGLAVGVTGPHGMPDEVRIAADVVLDTPFDAARALSALARAVEAEAGGGPP